MFAQVAGSLWAWTEQTSPHISRWRISIDRPQHVSDGFLLAKNEIGPLARFFEHMGVEYWEHASDQVLCYLSQRSSQHPGVSLGSLRLVFEGALSRSPRVGFRVWAPLPAEYVELAMRPMRAWSTSVFSFRVTGPYGLLPLWVKRTADGRQVSAPSITEYIQWVHRHRANPSVTVERTARLTLKLLQEAHDYFTSLKEVQILFNVDELRETVERDLKVRRCD